MGSKMSLRLKRDGHEVVGFDLCAPACTARNAVGLATVATLEQLARAPKTPRVACMTVPAEGPNDRAIANLSGLAQAGNTVIDDGNSNYKTEACARPSRAKIASVDAETSGGVWGLENGYCLIGRWGNGCGRSGWWLRTYRSGWSGSSRQDVPNGIDHGRMRADGEGFEITEKATGYDLGPRPARERGDPAFSLGRALLAARAHRARTARRGHAVKRAESAGPAR